MVISAFRKIGEPQKAEAFLLDAVKMYGQEGWHSLAHATMRELAACQKQMGHTKRFVRSVALALVQVPLSTVIDGKIADFLLVFFPKSSHLCFFLNVKQ